MEEHELKMLPNDSPSVRVRRLMKQETANKKIRLTKDQMKERLTDLMINPVSSGTSPVVPSTPNTFKGEREMIFQNQQMRIFAEIKMEIRLQFWWLTKIRLSISSPIRFSRQYL